MKKLFLISFTAASMLFASTSLMFAQDEVEAADEAAEAKIVQTDNSKPKAGKSEFWNVLVGSGAFGIILWLALFGAGGFYIYICIECSILVRAKKIMPQQLIDNVESAMKEGDIVKALQYTDNDPTPMASILSAGFSHVEEGFEVIQEAISTAADLEVERIMQRLTWLAVDGNIAPMLGLLGTVQGMIMAFSGLASGSPDVGQLALAIAQALWTTAAGLVIAIPCVGTYYSFRNNANRIVLRMEAITMELIKDLRNVEVVAD